MAINNDNVDVDDNDDADAKCTDPKKLDGLLNMFIDTEFGIAPDSFRLILV